MARQDKEAFDQRGDQNRNDDDGQWRYDLSHDIANEPDGGEGGDGGERGRDDRRSHGACRAYRGLGSRQALTIERGGMLAHHNGIIDDNPEHHHEREHRDHVEREPHEVHSAERSQDSDGNAHGHPDGNAAIEKQEQNHKDENKAGDTV